MSFDSPLQLSRSLLAAMGTRMFVYHEDRIPSDCAVVVVSNHRGFMDAPLLMAALGHPIRIACHHYMGQVPMMREFVTQLGCFPLEEPEQRGKAFFQQATQLLKQRQWVGVFPEGAQPMVHFTKPDVVGEFQRGFAHLALRAPVRDLAILPIAIASLEETVNSAVPLRFLRLFDPSEPLFEQPGWHPMVIHRRVAVLVGHPRWITPKQRELYQGRQARTVVSEITTTCRDEISKLLYQSFH
ncbi:MAG TPA: 1-acyl-sn-glycerol-3-phosphate acyltransferase [Cyanobacteria bacterium UBA8553]|nr:1-acyl-sn-glycerol-3-phosphate acyltransferase [Cyanobacteria bacterium UBA8553]HAJ58048.1 1-acyl-sn-glycerol-3-phosphate acyltransferase [Cyanobacteria bacterium UBA8543]